MMLALTIVGFSILAIFLLIVLIGAITKTEGWKHMLAVVLVLFLAGFIASSGIVS